MASIARCREALKSEPFAQSELVREYLSQETVAAAAAAAKYRWRERLWNPALTVWTFLLQVLHPGWACREVVAHVLAQHEAIGASLNASPDPSAYSQGRKRLPLSLFQYGLRKVGETLQAKVGEGFRWCGRRVWIVGEFRGHHTNYDKGLTRGTEAGRMRIWLDWREWWFRGWRTT
jgi:hypothetical protein